MLTQSDNTATDVLAAAAGGPQAITAWVQGQGVHGLWCACLTTWVKS